MRRRLGQQRPHQLPQPIRDLPAIPSHHQPHGRTLSADGATVAAGYHQGDLSGWALRRTFDRLSRGDWTGR
jgi:hypothetical protein